MNAPDRAAVRPADERLRACGQDLVLRLLALVRVGRSYQVENQVFRQQLRAFVAALPPAFAEAHEVVLVTLDDDLYLNGVRLPVKAANLRFHQALVQELTRRRIAGVRIAEGVEEAELERFFRCFLQPDVYAGAALLEACAAAGPSRILPAVHASTDAGGADPLDPASCAGWTEGAPAGGGGGGGGGGGHAAAAGPQSPTGDATAGAVPPRAAGARPVARKSYSLAMLGARSLLTATALQQGVPLSRAKRVVQPLIDGAFAGEPVVLGLSTLSHHDEYTYAHSVNVCLVAVTIGHRLGLDRRALADLGVAALLHDVGKAAVYDRIRHPLEAFDEEERRLAESHALEGVKLIARSTALNPSTLRCLRAALEHHAGPGGYPPLPADWRVSRLSEIVAVADCFVSLQMHRSERGRSVTPHEALGMVLGPCAARFHPAALWALVRSVGFYPPGQLVELSDGRTALVLAPNPDDPARPHVRIVLDECGVPFSAVEARELRPVPDSLAVTRALRADEYPELPQAA